MKWQANSGNQDLEEQENFKRERITDYFQLVCKTCRQARDILEIIAVD